MHVRSLHTLADDQECDDYDAQLPVDDSQQTPRALAFSVKFPPR